MNIILTGSFGFLGSQLYDELHKYKQSNASIINKVIQYDIINGFDILNSDQMEEQILLHNINVIIHLAAVSDLNIYANNPEMSYNINIIGTRKILALCTKYNIRLLFASTCCIYGNNNVHPSDETSPIAPTEAYAKSKAISEQDILNVGLPHVCMRLATFYGKNMRNALAPAIFSNRVHHNLPIEIHGDGKQTRTFTHVSDIVNGIMTILLSPPIYTIINVTNTEIISVLEMAEIIQNIMGKKVEIIHVSDRKGQIYHEDISNHRLMELGWKPKINFVEGMKQYIDTQFITTQSISL